MTDSSLPPLILASASPRRRDLLSGLGLHFEVMPVDAPEQALAEETPEEMVLRLAALKAGTAQEARPDALVLAADTLVVLDEPDGPRALGKPADTAEARRMLADLSGVEHRVLTGVALQGPGSSRGATMGETRVRFAQLDPRRIDWYVSTGEPLDKAGAYGIQGSAALLIESIHGSWSNVVGLPLERLPQLFAEAGYDLLEFLR